MHPFRITRNADVRRDEEEAEDLLAMISAELRERRFAPVVRMEVGCAMPEHDRRLLMRELGLQPDDVYEIDGLLNLADCALFADLDLADHLYPAWEPVVPRALQHMGDSQVTPDIFALLRQGDMLVHHPYESFMASVHRLERRLSIPRCWLQTDALHGPIAVSRRSSRRPNAGSRSPFWWRSRRVSTRPTTSSGRRCWKMRASTSPMGWSG